MKKTLHSKLHAPDQLNECGEIRSHFSGYLDGAVSGLEMAWISQHLAGCSECTDEFKIWRDVQRSLGDLGPVKAPVSLQAKLRAAVGAERERGMHLPLHLRAVSRWKTSLAPLALRLSGAVAAAIMLAGGLGWMFGAPIVVQANDDAMAHLIAPRYLYSQVPPEPLRTHHDAPVVVEAMVDNAGRVYDYSILEGPHTAEVKLRVENNLLGSVFRPATVFGVPVNGHVVLTYMGVSVHG
jgi:anti-sigma factor RsiW